MPISQGSDLKIPAADVNQTFADLCVGHFISIVYKTHGMVQNRNSS